jgi:hypothetical protein
MCLVVTLLAAIRTNAGIMASRTAMLSGTLSARRADDDLLQCTPLENRVQYTMDEVCHGSAPEAEEEAARKIQRNYRGYRERRQLNGYGLDASARWAEVCSPICKSMRLLEAD